MVMTGDNTCVTSLRPTFKAVACGKQKPYWLELQFVDENNQPVSGLKVQLEYHPLATAAQPEQPAGERKRLSPGDTVQNLALRRAGESGGCRLSHSLPSRQ
ncbi:hypothetical protein ABQJ14_002127 [Salmonella enterica]